MKGDGGASTPVAAKARLLSPEACMPSMPCTGSPRGGGIDPIAAVR
jgi:hypothetical protein